MVEELQPDGRRLGREGGRFVATDVLSEDGLGKGGGDVGGRVDGRSRGIDWGMIDTTVFHHLYSTMMRKRDEAEL